MVIKFAVIWCLLIISEVLPKMRQQQEQNNVKDNIRKRKVSETSTAHKDLQRIKYSSVRKNIPSSFPSPNGQP